jgi:hypothetical protein
MLILIYIIFYKIVAKHNNFSYIRTAIKMGLIMKENIKDILILLIIFGLLSVAGSFYGFSADDIISTPTQQIKF